MKRRRPAQLEDVPGQLLQPAVPAGRSPGRCPLFVPHLIQHSAPHWFDQLRPPKGIPSTGLAATDAPIATTTLYLDDRINKTPPFLRPPPPPPNLQIAPPTMSSTQGIVASFVEGAPPGEVRSPWSRNQQHQNLPLTCARRPAGRCYRRHDPPPYSPEEPDRIEQDRETERPI